ncbi:MAG TPA: hypothetical protein VJ528_11015, partial [Geothrix sp.]|nr:hypothetical protein [Geothrix sp.]
MSNPEPQGGGWQGARPLRLLATLAVGCLLYVILPRVAPVPDAKFFAGSAAAKAKNGAKPGEKAAKPADKPKPAESKAVEPKAAEPKAAASTKKLSPKDLEVQRIEAEAKLKFEAAAKAKADAEAKVKAEADAKAKAEAEKVRQADWVRGLHLFAIFVATILGIILRPLPM